MKILETQKLVKAFGALVVTNSVDFSVARNERHAIIGPNGAGKTSLLNQLSGQMKPTSGRIFFKGRDITGTTPELRCRLGMGRTFQRNNLFPNLSVFENVSLAIQSRRGFSWHFVQKPATSAEVRLAAEQTLNKIHMLQRAQTTTRDLSYGEQRQLEIGVALACEPELLILDEPTSGMSPAETDRVTELVKSLPSDLTIIIVEHDMQVVFALADRITVLNYGRILATGTPLEISMNNEVRSAYLGDTLDRVNGHAGT